RVLGSYGRNSTSQLASLRLAARFRVASAPARRARFRPTCVSGSRSPGAAGRRTRLERTEICERRLPAGRGVCLVLVDDSQHQSKAAELKYVAVAEPRGPAGRLA